jgi:tetratricopeptide (TPR) repeat protein
MHGISMSSLQKEIFSLVISVRYLSLTPLFLASIKASLSDYQVTMRALFEKPISYYDKALEIDPNNEYALADKSLALANIGKHKDNKIFEQYFVEKELKGNWRIIIPTDKQSSITNQQPTSQNWHIYNALDNTSCEIHMLTHDENNDEI